MVSVLLIFLDFCDVFLICLSSFCMCLSIQGMQVLFAKYIDNLLIQLVG